MGDDRSTRGKRVAAGVAATLTLAIVVTALLYRPHDAPFAPRDDAEVIERVVAGAAVDPAADEIRAMEQALARAPDNLALALPLARRQLSLALRADDLNRLSYAEAAMAPWAKGTAVPEAALVERAALHRARHAYPEALADLDAAVKAAPGDEQAWLARAGAQVALARYDEARRSCAALASLRPLLEATCAVEVEGVVGQPQANQAASQRLLVLLAAPGIDVTVAARARLALATAASCRDDDAAALQLLRAALAADPNDVDARLALADLLLAAHRDQDAISLIDASEPNARLLLRRAIAATALGMTEAAPLRDRLKARADELRARGDVAHEDDEARRLAFVEKDPVAALALATSSFAQAQLPAAARLLLLISARAAESAPAKRAEREAAADPVRRWAASVGCRVGAR